MVTMEPLEDIVALDKLSNLLSRVNYRAPNGCWEWTGGHSSYGYGMYRAHKNAANSNVHRLFYRMRNGPIPPKYVVDHLCRNPPCVNPDHLEAVTSRENTTIRGLGCVSGLNLVKTHCSNGHEFDYTYSTKSGKGRGCTICRREAVRRYRKRNRADG